MLSFAALALIALVAAQPYRGVFLSNGGTTLSIFELDNADKLATRPISGATTKLDAVDFRATDGALIGYQKTGASEGKFFVVNPCTGATTALLGTAGAALGLPVVVTLPQPTGAIDIDVNPLRAPAGSAAGASCGIRIIGGDVNVPWNVCTNLALTLTGALGFDTLESTPAVTTPNAVALAYANNVNNGGTLPVSTLTTVYAVDATTDSLYVLNIIAGATAGKLTLIGAVGEDIVAGAGLDVFTDVSRVPANRLILKNANRLSELNPLTGAIIDSVKIHDAPVAGESGLAIGRFSCSAPNARTSSSSSSTSSDSSDSSTSTKK